MSTTIVMPPQPGGATISSRLDNVVGIPAAYRVPNPPPPRSVRIELTSECNFRCGFGAHPVRRKKRGQMDWDLYTRLVGEMTDAGVRELGLFFIGESFACEWLPEAIAFAKGRGIEYAFLATNGSLATPERVQACLDAGLDSLRFSMNYADVAQFRQIARVKGQFFHDAVANLKAARRVRDEGRYACGLYASSMRYDGALQEKMQSLVNEILPYVDDHYWSPRPWVGPPCWSLFTEGHVTFDGKLSACSFEVGERWVMADLTESTFIDAWWSERFRKLREAHLRRDLAGTVCEKCAAHE